MDSLRGRPTSCRIHHFSGILVSLESSLTVSVDFFPQKCIARKDILTLPYPLYSFKAYFLYQNSLWSVVPQSTLCGVSQVSGQLKERSISSHSLLAPDWSMDAAERVPAVTPRASLFSNLAIKERLCLETCSVLDNRWHGNV